MTETPPARPDTGTSQDPTAVAEAAAPANPVQPVGPGAADGEPDVRIAPAARPIVPAVDPAVIAELRRSLGVTHVTAQALARRGLQDPAEARTWLAGQPGELVPLPNLDDAVELVLRHVREGHQILVHGDYDVDGVSATAILLDVLELLGAAPKWHLPKRGTDGYGLTAASLERIGRLDPKLVITVDCGITAVDETALLRDAGIDVLITDHHLPRGDGTLPDTAILHPGVEDGVLVQRTGEPCGAGVAASLAIALLEKTGHAAAPLRDGIAELTALATIADCVPLVGENRSAARAGIAALARTRRPGLRALLRSARVDATALDGTAVAFRLTPRLNAAGRMARADLALALIRARTDEDASRIAEELERCNLRRREVELVVRRKAEQQVRELGERSGYVLSGEGWPAGVIGITASRIAEDTDRPCVIIGIDGEQGSGSARSARGLDLAALMEACSEHLLQFGGHAAAAGCSIDPANIPAFAAAFDEAAAAALAEGVPETSLTVDAVAEVRDLTLGLAEELAAFEPTGEGNPTVRLLLPSVRVLEDRPMGQGNDHRRAVISSGSARTNAVAFNSPALPVGVPVDLVVQLERNVYGGTVEARVVIQSVHPLEKSASTGARKVGIDASALAAMLAGYHDEVPAWQRPPAPADDRRGSSVASVLRVAAAAGRDPIAYAADPARRAVQLESLGWRGPVIGPSGLQAALELTAPDHGVVVCVDPPIDPRAASALASSSVEAWWTWSDAELTYGVHVLEREFALRPIMVSLFRGLREAGKPLPALALLALLPQGHAPAALGRAVRVLDDLGLARVEDGLSSVALVSDAASDPTQSAVYRNAHAVVEEARAWTLLTRPST